jgi:flagellar biosynthesis anti-sigma factor FlgM
MKLAGAMNMDIRNSLEGLRTLLGVGQAAPTTPQGKSVAAASTGNAFDADRATLSSAGSEVSQAASAEDVRTEKVVAVQAALAAGTYNVPAVQVASKIVDSMLGKH